MAIHVPAAPSTRTGITQCHTRGKTQHPDGTSVEGKATSSFAYGIPDEEKDEFYYGFRYVSRLVNGKKVWEQVALTQEDVLHPELGDYVSQNRKHATICTEMYPVLREHLRRTRPHLYVFYDEVIKWAIPNQRNHAPDMGVMEGMHGEPEHGTLDQAKYGGKPVLFVEVTSPSTRDVDVEIENKEQSKYLQYEQIGVPYYVVIDAVMQYGNNPIPINGYQLVRGIYHPIPINRYGHIVIPPLDIAVGHYQDRAAWFDAQGNRLLNLADQQERANREQERADREVQARQAAEARAQQDEEELRRLKEQLGIKE